MALEHAKKETMKAKGKKSSRGGSLSRSGMPRGWIQGDWIRSTIRQDDIDDLVEGGLIAHESVRLPEGETKPQPQEGECILLTTHLDRGFSLPPHPFFWSFLNEAAAPGAEVDVVEKAEEKEEEWEHTVQKTSARFLIWGHFRVTDG